MAEPTARPWELKEHPANPNWKGFPQLMRLTPKCEGSWPYFKNPLDADLVQACVNAAPLAEELARAVFACRLSPDENGYDLGKIQQAVVLAERYLKAAKGEE